MSARSLIRLAVPTADNIAPRDDGGNLAAVLLNLARSNEQAKAVAHRRIVSVVRGAVPFILDLVLAPDEQDRVALRWREVG